MPVFDFSCSCGRYEERLVNTTERQYCACGSLMDRMVPRVRFHIPEWMSDANIDRNAERRRYLKANAHRLELQRDEDDDPMGDDFEPQSTGPSAGEMAQALAQNPAVQATFASAPKEGDARARYHEEVVAPVLEAESEKL